jgi:hypothetical protein
MAAQPGYSAGHGFWDGQMLKLRSIGLSDYAVLESGQRIGAHPFGHRTHAVRLALERHYPPDRRAPHGIIPGPQHGRGGVQGGTPLFRLARHPEALKLSPMMCSVTSSGNFAAWKALKARTPPEDLAAAYKVMNIRDDG